MTSSFALFRLRDMSDEKYAGDMRLVERGLETLRTFVTNRCHDLKDVPPLHASIGSLTSAIHVNTESNHGQVRQEGLGES